MQTFLPEPSFEASAASLDRLRLGKQRIENLQLMRAITDPQAGWRHHPCVGMWRHHPCALYRYHVAICAEWTGRGYRDTCLEQGRALHADFCAPDRHEEDPGWLGRADVHAAYRSALIAKDPAHYGPLWPGTPAGLEHPWPQEPAPG